MSGPERLEPRPERLGPVKLIGLGGVGSIVARHLLLFLAGLDHALRVVLVDGDEFEPRNAERMFFSRCGNKAVVVLEDLAEALEDTLVTVTAVEEFVSPKNLEGLVLPGDVVLLAVDNHATRKLVGEYCTRLDDVTLISGGNDGVGPDTSGVELRGTYGNVQIHLRRGGRDETPTLMRYHPEIADPADRHPDEPSCGELVLSVPQILFTNLATASAMLNAYFLLACEALHYPELCFDIADGLMRPVALPSPQGRTVPVQ